MIILISGCKSINHSKTEDWKQTNNRSIWIKLTSRKVFWRAFAKPADQTLFANCCSIERNARHLGAIPARLWDASWYKHIQKGAATQARSVSKFKDTKYSDNTNCRITSSCSWMRIYFQALWRDFEKTALFVALLKTWQICKVNLTKEGQ